MQVNTEIQREVEARAGAPVMAVCTNAETINGLSTMQGVGLAGAPVYALGQDEQAIGYVSRFATRCKTYPNPDYDPDGFAETLLEVGRELKRDGIKGVLLTANDPSVKIIASRREELEDYFIVPQPDAAVIRACLDKTAQTARAQEIGVPTPATYTDEQVDALWKGLQAGEFTFPLLFKARSSLPSHLRKQFRVFEIHTVAELEKQLADAEREKVRFLIQDIIPGDDDTLYTFGSYMNRAGEATASFSGRKLRQQPPRFGTCRVGECVYVPEVIEQGEALLRAMGYYGISQVEFKYDHRDGKYKLIEINPRSWLWIGLAVGMGVNIPAMAYADAVGVELPKQEQDPERRGLWISLYEDLYWSLAAKNGRPWAHLFKGYDVVWEPHFSPREWRCAMRYYGGVAKLMSGTVGRRLGLAKRKQAQDN